MTTYKVIFWESKTGIKPVAKWITSLPEKDRIYLGELLKDLALDGVHARPKIFHHLEGDLWEIRDLRVGQGFRIYFGYSKGNIICLVVNAGNKSTQQRDIELAKQRLKGD